jgi:hypothetical protein
MDGDGDAPEKGHTSQPPNKMNSKDGVDEERLTRGSQKGSVGYAPPLNTIGNTGEPRLTHSKSNPYDLWLGLGDNRDLRKRPTPAA